MSIDSEFVLRIADLHEDYMEEERGHQDPRYREMHDMLSNLNDEEWLDFLTIYYLGKGSIDQYDGGHEIVKTFGKHVVEQPLGKSLLYEYLRKGDVLRKQELR